MRSAREAAVAAYYLSTQTMRAHDKVLTLRW
jgi:hypothetical protein